MAIENRKVIGSARFNTDPHVVWNEFVGLIAGDYASLTRHQQPAHLVFWYESEVQNGGHLQYFLNRGTDYAQETIAALHMLNAAEHAELLKKAMVLWKSKERSQPLDIDEYVDVAREGEFEDLDSMFYSASTELTAVLQNHLAQNEELFIVQE